MTQSVFFGLQLSSNQEFSEVLALTRLSEKLGYDAVFYGMDDLTMRNLDCWTVLAALATQTMRIRLGPMMSFFTHRHPSALARAVATLDRIANGRIEWRVAPGSPEMATAWQKHGIDTRSARESIELMDEGLTVFKKLCVATEPVTFQGQYFHLQGATLFPQPAQRPYPPISVPASGLRMLGVAAKHAQIWIGSEYFLDPELLEAKRDRLREICEETGRDYSSITPSIELLVFVDEEGDVARLRADAFRQESGLPEEFLAHHAIGTPADCIQAIEKWLGRDVRRFDLWFEQPEAGEQAIRLFGEEVIPHLRANP